jgi:hypothetical protein
MFFFNSSYLIGGFEPERCCNNPKAKALLEQNPAQDAPGNAEAGVEGANRMFATGTPNPPCSEN